jgi:ADP-ribose pyrophosphatase YjhB (NUDIX family)
MAPGYGKYCHWCGAPYPNTRSWPRKCSGFGGCGRESYDGPKAVAVVLVECGGQYVAVKRAIHPIGLALPGGYLDHKESWQAAAVRELGQETSIQITPEHLTHLHTESTPDGREVLIFSTCTITEEEWSHNKPDMDETSNVILIDKGTELVFSLHTKALGMV